MALPTLAGLLLGLVGTVNAESVVVPGKWMVELEAPAGLEHDGKTEFAVRSQNSRLQAAALPATAPQATGQRYSTQSAEVRTYAAFLDNERRRFLDDASLKLGRQLSAEHVYRHTLNGFSIELSDEEAEQLGQLPGVKSLRPVMAHDMHLDSGPEVIHAPDVHAGLPGVPPNGGEGVVIGIIDSGINWDHPYFSDAPLDGFQFSNPYGRHLGECRSGRARCNSKLVGVYDFTIEKTDGKDPSGHGTHVASIAAGVPIDVSMPDVIAGDYVYRTTGVAPRANIISYKVCYKKHPSNKDLDDKCEGSAIQKAWEQAVTDGVDVVNYSIGGDANDPWKNSRQLLNMRDAGILFVTSAGNDGPDYGSISRPANAPWVLTVGNSTHSRREGQKATLAGLDGLLLTYGPGAELHRQLSGRLVDAGDVSSSGLACQAFPAGSLNSSIVLVQRGDCTFEEKVAHASAAGAAAVLVYNNVEGAPILMGGLERARIPAAMMSLGDGLAVREAMSGQDSPQGTLYVGGRAEKRPDWQDEMTDSSSRGPAPFAPNLMKPNVVAPGTNVLAGDFHGGNPYIHKTGTSMASPHVAGAAALLKSLHPNWTPDMLQSALETTAEAEPVRWDGKAASAHDRGNGRIRVDRAARAGLYLPVSRNAFLQANPQSGGDSGQLNLAGLLNESCGTGCSFERTVKAIEGGEWTVETGGQLDVSVSPSSFSLARGESQRLTIEVSPGRSEPGVLGDGHIELVPLHEGFVPQRLRIAAGTPRFGMDTTLRWAEYSNRGQRTETLDIGPLPEAVFRSSSLVLPERRVFELEQHSSPDNPYTGTTGRRVFLVDVPDDTLMLTAEVLSSSARDVDLFVGHDSRGDGQPAEASEYCRSTGDGVRESCRVELPRPGTWWVMVQNWRASKSGASDDVELEMAVLTTSDSSSLVVNGPGHHPGGELDLQFAWDEPAMMKDRWYAAAVGLYTSPESPAAAGVFPLFIKRVGDNRPQPTALFDGESLPVVIPGKKVHDLLFVDVPPGATGLEVEVSGQTGISGQLFRLDHDEVADAAPGTPPAPTDGALDEGRDAGSGFVLGHSSSSGISAGRYYVVLDNNFANERRVNVMASIKQSAAPAPVHYGLWSDHGRGINQGFDWGVGQAGSQPIASLVWYTYDEDGLPVFYTANAPIDPDSATWSSELLRVTSNNERDHLSTVGRVSVTELAADDMIIAWRLNGRHGSSRVRPDHSQACAVVDGESRSYSGHWYAPGLAQGGTTMIVTDAVQTQVRYYFDALGVGRWVITDDQAGDGPLAEQLAVVEFHGYCDGCEAREISSETVGSYARLFHDEDHATEIVEFVSRPPLGHDYSAEVEIERLTTRLECP